MFSENATNTETVFWICALLGTAFFALKMMLTIVGGIGEADVDAHDINVDGDVGHDFDAHHDGDVGGDSDIAFKLLSLTSISSFIMMFGWVGLACYKQYGLGAFVSLVCALIGGVIMMMAVSYIFYFAKKLTSSGADFRIDSIVGETASVYQKIPADGRGKIQISVSGILREIDAVSEESEEIASFTNVVVTKVISPEAVAVKKA